MVNKELLKNTLDLINANPETHHQANWVRVEPANVCGTVMCFAGHAAVLAGAEIPDPKKHKVADWYVGKDGQYLNYEQAGADGDFNYVAVSDYARKALGLSNEQANYLFGPDLDRDDLYVAVQELLNDEEISAMQYMDDDDDYGDCPCCDY